ncbi:divergent polysaccharide deacetylase [bacterium BMS3Bbin04]|nr:divergent polysaccharide deacetylase [bacterium BMS3Bbin04]
MDLPIPLTVGIIPGLAATSAIAEIAEERGHEILVHVPMEAVGEREDTEPVVLSGSMGLTEFQEFMSVVEQVPHAIGLSNHQGSAATQDTELMRNLALWCSHRGWIILDSITHPGSVLYQQAIDQGVQAFKRDLFLDHHPESDSLRARLGDAERLAINRDRPVIIIGHPRATTLSVLQEEIPRLMEQGIEFVRLRDTLPAKIPMAVRGER